MRFVNPFQKKHDLRIFVSTDWHHLSSSMHDDGEEFRRMLIASDGKLTEYSTQIVQGMVDKVLAEKPDAFLMLGDMSYDGDTASMKECVDFLEQIRTAGIPVCVIPGNHDTDNPFACAYRDGKSIPADRVSKADFRSMMKQFGYGNSISHAKDSFSFVFDIGSGVWVLALDANAKDYGVVPEETMKWAEEMLKKAQKKHKSVIGMTHQNLLAQSEFMGGGFLVKNSAEILRLYETYGVKVNLSGHAHLQHHVQKGPVTEYCTGSLTVNKECYGIVEVKDGVITYTKQYLGVEAEKAQQRFLDTVSCMVDMTLKEPDLPSDIREQMICFAASVNSAYFAEEDHLSAFVKNPAWKLWQQYGKKSFWYEYMNRFFHEENEE